MKEKERDLNLEKREEDGVLGEIRAWVDAGGISREKLEVAVACF